MNKIEKLIKQHSPGGACLPRRNEYCVYVLKCSDNSFYIGQTDNFARRIEEHKSGKGAEWVKKRLPFEPIHWEVFSTRSEAVKRERELKTGFGRKWLKREYKKDALAASRRRQVEFKELGEVANYSER